MYVTVVTEARFDTPELRIPFPQFGAPYSFYGVRNTLVSTILLLRLRVSICILHKYLSDLSNVVELL
jgi:hypothetical protein